jgi:hypothetical protein
MKKTKTKRTIEYDGNDKQFSVCRFWVDETYVYVARWINFLEATRVLRQCSLDFDSQIGATTRIIVTDGLDCINIEWVYGKGITYPTKEMMEEVI